MIRNILDAGENQLNISKVALHDFILMFRKWPILFQSSLLEFIERLITLDVIEDKNSNDTLVESVRRNFLIKLFELIVKEKSNKSKSNIS